MADAYPDLQAVNASLFQGNRGTDLYGQKLREEAANNRADTQAKSAQVQTGINEIGQGLNTAAAAELKKKQMVTFTPELARGLEKTGELPEGALKTMEGKSFDESLFGTLFASIARRPLQLELAKTKSDTEIEKAKIGANAKKTAATTPKPAKTLSEKDYMDGINKAQKAYQASVGKKDAGLHILPGARKKASELDQTSKSAAQAYAASILSAQKNGFAKNMKIPPEGDFLVSVKDSNGKMHQIMASKLPDAQAKAQKQGLSLSVEDNTETDPADDTETSEE